VDSSVCYTTCLHYVLRIMLSCDIHERNFTNQRINLSLALYFILDFIIHSKFR
ncbi:hypothetical protein ACJX0J_023666, partial [Zea mays]